MKLFLTARTGLLIACCGVLCACIHNVQSASPTPYFGPTDTLSEVIAHINANNAKLPTLWAHISDFEATFSDPDNKNTRHFVNADGKNLMYAEPRSLRIAVSKNSLIDLFEIGSNDREFWFWNKQENVFYTGEYANLNVTSERLKDMPIRPDLILAVLGIGKIDTDLLKLPAPVMHFSNNIDAYMIQWIDKSDDHWAGQKEIWYDRKTYLPRNVMLSDANGNQLVWAKLTDFEPVESEKLQPAEYPKMATHYELYFPQSDSTAKFTITDQTVSHDGFPDPEFSFKLPNPPADTRIIHVDEKASQ